MSIKLQEALDFAHRMSDAEQVSFATKATITCEVDLTMTNRAESEVRVHLYFPEFEGISLTAHVDAEYVAVPSAEEVADHNQQVIATGEGSLGLPIASLPVTLSAEEVCKIFALPESADWEMTNHGTFLGEED